MVEVDDPTQHLGRADRNPCSSVCNVVINGRQGTTHKRQYAVSSRKWRQMGVRTGASEVIEANIEACYKNSNLHIAIMSWATRSIIDIRNCLTFPVFAHIPSFAREKLEVVACASISCRSASPGAITKHDSQPSLFNCSVTHSENGR